MKNKRRNSFGKFKGEVPYVPTKKELDALIFLAFAIDVEEWRKTINTKKRR